MARAPPGPDAAHRPPAGPAPVMAGVGAPDRALPATRAGGRVPAAGAGRTALGGRAHPAGRAAWAAPAAPPPGPAPVSWKAGTAPTAATGQRAAGAARPVWAGAGRAARAAWAGPAEAGWGPPGGLLRRRRRPRRRHGYRAAVAGFRWSARCLAAVNARLRRPLCPRAVVADRYAIACLCPPGHMEPDRARDPPRDSRTYWDICFNRNS
jgi:hypothetical protein